MTNKKVQPDRIWIELDRPRDPEHAERLCKQANAMLDRLYPLDAPDVMKSHFFWNKHEGAYCYGGDHGYVTCADRGQWFRSDKMATEKESSDALQG